MLTLLLVLNSLMSIQNWFLSLLSLKVQTPLQSLFLLLLLLLLWFLLLLLSFVLLLQVLLPLHVMLVFFDIPNAVVSFSNIVPHASGRSPQTSCICNGAHVATDVFTDQD